jgi:hypothetical protein
VSIVQNRRLKEFQQSSRVSKLKTYLFRNSEKSSSSKTQRRTKETAFSQQLQVVDWSIGVWKACIAGVTGGVGSDKFNQPGNYV